MANLDYKIENFNSDTFIQMPHRDPDTLTCLYRKPLADQVYPRIYKNENEWREYCVFDGGDQPFYAKENGKPYYPVDSEGRIQILADDTGHPMFIKEFTITFVHLHEKFYPFKDIDPANEFEDFKDSYVMYVTKADFSVGDFYINQMFTNSEGLNIPDKSFTLRANKVDLIVYSEGVDRDFIFVKDERHYLKNISEKGFVELDSDLIYDLDLKNRKLYRLYNGLDFRYFIVQNRTEQHFILASNDTGLHAYKMEDDKLAVYFPDYPDLTRHLWIGFNVEDMGQELDKKKRVVCYRKDEQGDKTYFWFENELLVTFDYEGNYKRRYIRTESNEKRYFKFVPEGLRMKIKLDGEDQLREFIFEGNEENLSDIPSKRHVSFKSLVLGFLILICVVVIYFKLKCKCN
jgi:hypothetical protein